MERSEFIKRFKLNSLQPSFHKFIYPKQTRAAAVLIAITEMDDQLSILLTKRAAHLKHHPGQISFPGGKVEPFDPDHIATALREAEEEIGLPQQNVEIIGQLKPYQTITGYVVTPIVAVIKQPEQYIQDHNEVAEIFHVPLHHFMSAENHHKVETFHKGKSHLIYFMPYKQYNIWGATAAMMADLVNHIK
ncbi:CoA pyrophosphatase [Thalassotalea atypica]|uniref:CoA pyrophosphatase n=1 Tax=Thalassotalea atypica TaxID=2054316 RepID=UPI0025743BB2|nr:CoA pyrophosphatase [Thalassotalea atypica]